MSGKDIFDLLDPPVQGYAPGHGFAVPSERVLGEIVLDLGRQAYRRGELELVAIQQVDLDSLTPAEPPRTLRHGSQHGASIRGGPAQSDQDRVGRRQLLGDLGFTQAVAIVRARLLIIRGH